MDDNNNIHRYRHIYVLLAKGLTRKISDKAKIPKSPPPEETDGGLLVLVDVIGGEGFTQGFAVVFGLNSKPQGLKAEFIGTFRHFFAALTHG